MHDGTKDKDSELELKLNKAMMMTISIANIQVAAIYRPPRVTDMARSIGLRAGLSLDRTAKKEDDRLELQWHRHEKPRHKENNRRITIVPDRKPHVHSRQLHEQNQLRDHGTR